MKRTWALALAATTGICAGLLAAHVEVRGSAIPDRMFLFAEAEFPYFVAADQLLDASGVVDSTSIQPEFLESIELLLQLEEVDDCVPLGPVFVDGLRDAQYESLDEAAETAALILEGRVTDSRPGFLAGTAGTMLRVTPIGILRSELKRTHAEYFYFVPVARFSLAGKSYCKSDPRYSGVPDAGDKVILLLDYVEESPLLPMSANAADGLIVVHSNGTVGLSGRFRSQSGRMGEAQVLSLIRTGLRNREER